MSAQDERDRPPGSAGGLGIRGRRPAADAPTAMRVLALDPAGGSLARCAAADGILATVETALLGPLETGAIVLVHAGVALARLDVEWGL